MKQLIESLIVAAIGGALTAAATAAVAKPFTWEAVGTSAAIGAIVAASALWRNRPVGNAPSGAVTPDAKG